MKKTIGVLALQGAFRLHQAHLESLGCIYKEVILPHNLQEIDGLIIPGGESSVLLNHCTQLDLWKKIKEFKKPLWGICAGAILMAKKVSSPHQKSLGIIDCEIERNAYGRQLDSFQFTIDQYPVAFIRAPIITHLGKSCKIVYQLNENPIWIEQESNMITTFHPELSDRYPSPIHKYFVENLISS